jgi:hypothetical protein
MCIEKLSNPTAETQANFARSGPGRLKAFLAQKIAEAEDLGIKPKKIVSTLAWKPEPIES